HHDETQAERPPNADHAALRPAAQGGRRLTPYVRRAAWPAASLRARAGAQPDPSGDAKQPRADLMPERCACARLVLARRAERRQRRWACAGKTTMLGPPGQN